MGRSNRTQFIILGLLAHDTLSGYEIKQEIAKSTAHFWAESDGQIYPALNQLSEQGHIKCHESATGARSRKRYSLTPSGHQLLQEWLKKDVERTMIRHELLLKLFFGGQTSKSVLLNHLERFQQDVEKKSEALTAIAHSLKKTHANSKDLKYWLITLDYGIRIAHSQYEWCDVTKKTLLT